MTVASFALDDRIAMATACTTLGLPAGSRGRDDVLSNREWNEVARWLLERQMRPADLLFAGDADLESDGIDPRIAAKARAIPDRASTVALEIEQLERVGIWTMSRADTGFPRRWKERLKSLAPAVIFGAGPAELLDRPAVAIVGSREITEELGELGNSIGQRVAQAGMMVVSGGARGSDRVGMQGALLDEGYAAGVLPADLSRLSKQCDVREFIADGKLCLVTQVNPGAGFSVGNAMARNRLIYALSDLAIIIATKAGSGGTWAGATENLKYRWAPMAVWTGPDAPGGNTALVEQGVFSFSELPADADSLQELIGTARAERPAQQAKSFEQAQQLGLGIADS